MSDATMSDEAYVDWLQNRSMLASARQVSAQFSGSGATWQNPFARPNPRAAVRKAPVWFTAYPISLVTRPGRSYLATLADEALWRVFGAIGVTAVHTGPVKEAGGLTGVDCTPSIDGHFDRISTDIDACFGTEAEFRSLCDTAAAHGGTIIDDIVPGHTGKGADFRLAERNVGDYPGIYHMVQIPPEDWHLLPAVEPGRDSANLDAAAERALEQAGHIVGRLQRVIFHDPGIKETNWSATDAVVGHDGVTRRWVYLHYFKDGQPSIDWLDPSFAGMRLVIGDALHSIGHLGAGALRLDANGFLGVEKTDAAHEPAWSEGHPLSDAANQLIASTVRKAGGFTFQELNLSIEDIKSTSQLGADLSYDFVNRPAYIHALATGDTEFLRLTLNAALSLDLQPVSLVHALQNHDEMTYELVHFDDVHRDDVFTFRGLEMSGAELATCIRGELVSALTGEAAPYNATFTTNGIASTTATLIAASLGITDVSALTRAQVDAIKQVHLLLAMFNAWQPGVFALSGWDLCGSLTLEPAEVADLLESGDTRWIHRSAYDLMNSCPEAACSASGMPRAVSLYGSLPEQLESKDSFVSRLRDVLAIRSRCSVSTATQVDVPAVSVPGMLAMVHRLEDGCLQVTALNFSGQPVAGSIASAHLPPGGTVTDMSTGHRVGVVDHMHRVNVSLGPYQGRSLAFADPR